MNFIDDTYENVLDLDEDILQIVSQDHKRIVDLGWYPSFNPNGLIFFKLQPPTVDFHHLVNRHAWRKKNCPHAITACGQFCATLAYLLPRD